jgi:hypothetical protein
MSNFFLWVSPTDNVKVITVRGTAFQDVETEGGSAEVVEGADPNAPMAAPRESASGSMMRSNSSFDFKPRPPDTTRVAV